MHNVDSEVDPSSLGLKLSVLTGSSLTITTQKELNKSEGFVGLIDAESENKLANQTDTVINSSNKSFG